MSEAKRVSFMTIDAVEDSPKKSEKEKPSAKKTFRIELEIFEPSQTNFADYNYKKLMFIEKKKQRKIAKLSNGAQPAAVSSQIPDDPFGDNDEEDVNRIAKQMEAKYGAGSTYSNIDRGYGYDDNDSFIDNTDAYDEIIPDDIETVRGGFYVNSGLLEFKKKPNFERPGDELHMPRAKKRILSTSESEGEGNKEKVSVSPVKAKKKKLNDEKKVKSTTASSSSDEQSKAAKKAKKEKQEKKVETPAVKKPETPSNDKKDKTIKAPTHKDITVKDMLRLKRDNLRKMEQSKSSGGGTTTTTDNDDDGSESVSSLAVSETSHESNVEASTPINGTKELSLPSDFPKELCDAISSLKTYAEKIKKDGANFFDNHMKDQLLKIDSLARVQGKGITGQVYRQLENFIPSTRKTILTKVNRFRIQHAENRIKTEIKKLKAALNTIMPELVRKYDEDLKQYEARKNISHIRESPTENKPPRRRFHWNDNLRQILYDIVQYISDFHQLTKAKKEPLNEYSAKYLKDHVMPLWPEDWIKMEDFQKELDKKKRKEGRHALGASPPQSAPAASNGKQPQKTENQAVNGKSPSHVNQTPSQSSVIKRSSDHSINSIINSASPSPPAPSTSNSNPKTPHVVELDKLVCPSDLLKVQPPKVPKFNHPSSVVDMVSPEKFRISDGSDSDHSINSIINSASPSPPAPSTSHSNPKTPHVVELDKLVCPSDLLKVQPPKVPKFNHPSSVVDMVSPEKFRISDGSDSDCAIIESPIKSATTIKPQQQQFSSHHLNNNNKVSVQHGSGVKQAHHQKEKEKQPKEQDFSMLISSIESLSGKKDTSGSSSFGFNPLSSPPADQRKMNTPHGINGTSDVPLMKAATKSYSNNLHYALNDFIKGSSKSSSDYQKQYTASMTNNNIVQNVSVITSTTDVGKGSSYAMPPVLNLSNKK